MPDQSYAATEHALLEEITRPLERIPEDPLELVHADFPTAMRGYDKAAVDEYVRETARLVAELQAVRTPEAAVRRALVRAGGTISGVLRRAHETAGEITARSRSEAEDRLERARVEADEIMDAAERRVRDLDADTDRIWLDRQRIMADVEDLSGQLHGLAKEAGERFADGDEQDGYDDEGESPVSGAEHSEPDAADDPAAWERWADHNVPGESSEADERVAVVAGDDAPAREPSPTSLTDNDETLPLIAVDRSELPDPPEVEPRSARLSSPHGPVDDRDRGSAGVIPPMSEAASRPRRP